MNYEKLSFQELLSYALVVGMDYDKYGIATDVDINVNVSEDILRIFLRDMDKERAMKQQLHDYAEYIEDLKKEDLEKISYLYRGVLGSFHKLNIEKAELKQKNEKLKQENKDTNRSYFLTVDAYDSLSNAYNTLVDKYNELESVVTNILKENAILSGINGLWSETDKPNRVEVNYYYKK